MFDSINSRHFSTCGLCLKSTAALWFRGCANDQTVISSLFGCRWGAAILEQTGSISKCPDTATWQGQYVLKGNCLSICCNGRPASVRRHTLFCVPIHTRALTLPYAPIFSRRLYAQILTLVTGSQPSPTLASSALHTHTLFSDSPLWNDGAHLPNRPCNLFENLCLRDEHGSPPDFITFRWPQRLTDLIAQSLVPPPLPNPTFLAQMTGWDGSFTWQPPSL